MAFRDVVVDGDDDDAGTIPISRPSAVDGSSSLLNEGSSFFSFFFFTNL